MLYKRPTRARVTPSCPACASAVSQGTKHERWLRFSATAVGLSLKSTLACGSSVQRCIRLCHVVPSPKEWRRQPRQTASSSFCGARWSAYIASFLRARSGLLQNLSMLNIHNSHCRRHRCRAYGLSKYEARHFSAIRPCILRPYCLLAGRRHGIRIEDVARVFNAAMDKRLTRELAEFKKTRAAAG